MLKAGLDTGTLDNQRGILSPELAILINLLDNCIIFGYFAKYENR